MCVPVFFLFSHYGIVWEKIVDFLIRIKDNK